MNKLIFEHESRYIQETLLGGSGEFPNINKDYKIGPNLIVGPINEKDNHLTDPNFSSQTKFMKWKHSNE
jgi:hypothetical protein